MASKSKDCTQAVPPELPLPISARSAGGNGIQTLLAASTGVMLGIGALVAFWLLWSSPPSRVTGSLLKSKSRFTETFVSGSVPVRQTQASMAPALELLAPVSEPNAGLSPKKPVDAAAIRGEKYPDLPFLAADEEALLLARGKALTASGDVAGARLAYEFAARRNSADAMFALAQTYDPEYNSAWSISGIRPNMSAALKWYGHAAKLGHDRAALRKRELEQQTGRLP